MNVCKKCDKSGKCSSGGDCIVRNPKTNVGVFLKDADKRLVGPSYPNRGWLLETCKY